MNFPIVVCSFYYFVALPDYVDLQEPFLSLCQNLELKGSILLAREGINGTIAGYRQGIDCFLAFLRSDSRFRAIETKESSTHVMPFGKMKVRLKQEIIKLGIAEVDPCQTVGTYVEPQDWNALITDREVTLIDTRNQYEVELGTFTGAINPHLDSFSEFPAFVNDRLDPEEHPKVAMFCTGGIRCEKASAFMLKNGFREVYHLKGGILKYLQAVSPTESLWEGKCFVFDERVSINHSVNNDPIPTDNFLQI